MASGLTMREANAMLSGIKTEQEFRDLVARISVSAEGSVSLLYSGGYPYEGLGGEKEFVGASALAEKVAGATRGIRIINHTEAARFLDVSEGGSSANQVLVDWLKNFLDQQQSAAPLEYLRPHRGISPVAPRLCALIQGRTSDLDGV
ncbi:MAG: hypothetical protein ACKO22_03185 [Cyanobium sp.]